MFVRGNFIEEHWDWIGCWVHIGVCVEEVGVWGPVLGEWLYRICRHPSLSLTNHQSDSFRKYFTAAACWSGLSPNMTTSSPQVFVSAGLYIMSLLSIAYVQQCNRGIKSIHNTTYRHPSILHFLVPLLWILEVTTTMSCFAKIHVSLFVSPCHNNRMKSMICI